MLKNKRFLGLILGLLSLILVFIGVKYLPSQNDVKKSQRRYAIVGEEIGATQLTDFNTWTSNNLGGVNVYSPYCIRIYSDGGSTWSYLWTTITFNALTIVNYNFHVTAENSNLRTGIRIYNPSNNTDYVNITETLTSPKTYQGSLIFQNAETIRFDLRRNYYGTGYSGGCVWSVSLAYSDYNTGFDDGYDDGYIEGYETGYDNGRQVGRDDVIDNPDDYDLYTELQYEANYDNGVYAVLDNPNSYNLYTKPQYDKNFQDGYDDGYVDGYNDGDADGYDVGFDDGYSQGETAGYNEGFSIGTREGYETGYVDGEDAGYTNGYEKGIESSTGFFAVIESATNSIHNFMSIEIIPGLTLATILGVFIGLPLFFFFLKLISGK